jgi:hypothetical protein
MLSTTFITDGNGKKISAVLPIKQYQLLLEELEELDDIKAYDKAVSRKQEFIPLDQALKQIETSRKKKK